MLNKPWKVMSSIALVSTLVLATGCTSNNKVAKEENHQNKSNK